MLKSLSPQAAKAYKLLLNNKTLSAKDVARELKILPNTVYRDLRELIRIGLIEKVNDYPVRYKAKPESEAVSLYTSIIRQNFFESFGLNVKVGQNLKIGFFQTRKDFLLLCKKDFEYSKEKINIIISGDELPPEAVFVHKATVDRGVKIRKLVQGLNEENIRMAKAWKRIGVDTKYTPLINSRIVTFDGKITILGYYEPYKQQECVGVRFEYAPFAALMDEMFEQKWEKAKEIN